MGRKFQVKAVDLSGEELLDKEVRTLKNGFFEIWLPRNRKVVLTVSGMNRTAVGALGTFDDSKTCITTFQLK